MATKQHRVHLSYEKGTADTQKGMKENAAMAGLTKLEFCYSCIVGHLGVKAQGGKRALKNFLETSGLRFGLSFIEPGKL
jgi:hypothetical protein